MNTYETEKEVLSTRPSVGRTPGTHWASGAHDELGPSSPGWGCEDGRLSSVPSAHPQPRCPPRAARGFLPCRRAPKQSVSELSPQNDMLRS